MQAAPNPPPPTRERTLFTAHKSMVRNAPVEFVVGLALCFIIVGIPFLLIWWLQCLGKTLIVTTTRTTLRRGILSKATTEVWHKDVRNVQITQSFFNGSSELAQ